MGHDVIEVSLKPEAHRMRFIGHALPLPVFLRALSPCFKSSDFRAVLLLRQGRQVLTARPSQGPGLSEVGGLHI